jgi:hypothetical protein
MIGGPMKFDPCMTLAYADDATSLETEVEVVDPDTGRSAAFTTDNLTTALYFIAAHGLLPVREGLKELATLTHSPDFDAEADERGIPRPSAALEGYRAANLLPTALFIQVHGDPDLVDLV